LFHVKSYLKKGALQIPFNGKKREGTQAFSMIEQTKRYSQIKDCE
jgi:hypothetical protein